jgi:hypothetical protein
MVVWLFVLCSAVVQAQALLPSWHDGPSKQAIISFVERTTREGSPDFIVPAKRIAVFDNDGTLWSEQPIYVQVMFMMDRIKALAPQNPHWQTEQPFKAVLQGDLATLKEGGHDGYLQLFTATHAGMTSEAFHDVVQQWLETARHPKTGRPYTEMVYQPMLELLDYLRANGFKPFIVSGGGLEFMRPWTEQVYGIPPEQVMGSSLKSTFRITEGRPEVIREPEIQWINDKEAKPVAIDHHIGRRPVMAFGNSDGDLQMLQWTTAGQGPRFALIVHHTDDVREVAYDQASSIGRLDKALEQAKQSGWTVVDMKSDWATVFPKP